MLVFGDCAAHSINSVTSAIQGTGEQAYSQCGDATILLMKLLIQYDLYAMTLNVFWAISKGINPLVPSAV